jgi:ABC-2 type transport system ATP-binding protein
MTRMLAAAIDAEDLVKGYGSTPAVDGVSLSAGRGVIGLLGPNGAGKTTLLRMLATVLAPDSGRLRLLGLDPGRPQDRLEIRRRLGYRHRLPASTPASRPSTWSTTWRC